MPISDFASQPAAGANLSLSRSLDGPVPIPSDFDTYATNFINTFRQAMSYSHVHSSTLQFGLRDYLNGVFFKIFGGEGTR